MFTFRDRNVNTIPYNEFQTDRKACCALKRQAERWKNMAIISSPLGEPLASEVIGALIDLTALARKANWVAAEHLESVANDMLTCVLTLCKAERGAVLLREDHARCEQS